MGEPNEQQQDIRLTGDKLVLKDASLVAQELMLDVAPSTSQAVTLAPKAGSYTVELFSDEALVTATELLYGDVAYALGDIDSLQILKLQSRRSVIQKKISNFIAIALMATGVVVSFSSLHWFLRLLAMVLAIGGMAYVIYFNWWIEQRGRGEFGLVITMKLESRVVITSHSLKAVQALYKIVFGRLDGGNQGGAPLVVNMYTGETMSR